MAKRVTLTTTFTTISKPGNYKPNTPFFAFVNTGSFACLINNFRLNAGDRFVLNDDAVIAKAIANGHVVENDTTFYVDNVPFQFLYCTLVETFVKIHD